MPLDATHADGTAELIACPQCDALYRAVEPGEGEKLVCRRCHHTLVASRSRSFVQIVALAVSILILMTGATFFPFLKIDSSGFSNSASVFDAALAFVDGGIMVALSLVVAALIILIPVLRAALVIYVVAPLAMGRRPLPGARRAFRMSETLRPWSMAEIFVIGVAVALVKVSDIAQVEYGIAFWMFAALVVIIVLQDGLMCRWTIWKTLDTQRS